MNVFLFSVKSTYKYTIVLYVVDIIDLMLSITKYLGWGYQSYIVTLLGIIADKYIRWLS